MRKSSLPGSFDEMEVATVTRQFVATKTKVINKGDSLTLRTDIEQGPANGFLGKSPT